MNSLLRLSIATAFIATMASTDAQSQDKAAYDRRLIERYNELFTYLDRDGDGTVTWLETQGDLNFTPVFTDMDINRDGIVTKAELARYLELRHGAGVLRP